MTQVLEAKNQYIALCEELASERSAVAAPWLAELRKYAIEHFEQTGFPTTKQEQWIHTSVKPIAETTFTRAIEHTLSAEHQEKLKKFQIPNFDAHRMVFVDGRFSAEHSRVGDLPKGVVMTNLAEAIENNLEGVEANLGKIASVELNPFVALNQALFEDGAFIYVPNGAAVEKGVEIVYVATGRAPNLMTHSRNLILAGDQAQVDIVERFIGLGSETSFTNAVTEVKVGENAHVDHQRINEETLEAYHISTIQAVQARSCVYDNNIITFGGKLVRNNLHALLDGEGIESHFNGLYLVDSGQHIDTHSVLDHAQPNCYSHELYKGILEGTGRAVFNGKIHVHKIAQKTDAVQSNRNLLLSDSARIYSQPQLEIFADDVRCTHGSTIGQIDREALFYLRSRGLSKEEAFAVLTDAFAGEVLDLVKLEPVRDYLHEYAHDRYVKVGKSKI